MQQALLTQISLVIKLVIMQQVLITQISLVIKLRIARKKCIRVKFLELILGMGEECLYSNFMGENAGER
jgi:hypothetical protein